MNKKQICRICEEELILTEILLPLHPDKRVYAYICGCDSMIKDTKITQKVNTNE